MKKIKGYIDSPIIDPPDKHTYLIASVVASPFYDANPVRPVTLIVHHEKHEPVFSEVEVKAILMKYAHKVEQQTGIWVSPFEI